jgi:hypothetical protein
VAKAFNANMTAERGSMSGHFGMKVPKPFLDHILERQYDEIS